MGYSSSERKQLYDRGAAMWDKAQLLKDGPLALSLSIQRRTDVLKSKATQLKNAFRTQFNTMKSVTLLESARGIRFLDYEDLEYFVSSTSPGEEALNALLAPF